MKNKVYYFFVAALVMCATGALAQNVGIGQSGPVSKTDVNGNVLIGSGYSGVIGSAAPTDGLRVEGKTVVGNSAQFQPDKFSSFSTFADSAAVNGYSSGTSGTLTGVGRIGVYGEALSGYGGFFEATTGTGTYTTATTGTGTYTTATGLGGLAFYSYSNGANTQSATTGKELVSGFVRMRPNQTGGGYGPYLGIAGSRAVSGLNGHISETLNSANVYHFGVHGSILQGVDGVDPTRAGGVLGTNITAGTFGVLAYESSGANTYCVYGGGGSTNGTIFTGNGGRLGNNAFVSKHIGIGISGGMMGGWIRGQVYGLMAKGDRYSLYVDGRSYVNDVITEITTTTAGEKVAAYVPVSTTADVYARGRGEIVNGELQVSFDKAFANLVEVNSVTVAITPIGTTETLYLKALPTNLGFSVAKLNVSTENLRTTPVQFTWIAIGTRKNLSSPPNELMKVDFEANMSGVMFDDANNAANAKAAYFDGENLKFEKMPGTESNRMNQDSTENLEKVAKFENVPSSKRPSISDNKK